MLKYLCLLTIVVALVSSCQSQIKSLTIPGDQDEANRMIDGVKNTGIPPTAESLYQATEDARQAADFYNSRAAELPKQLQGLNLEEQKQQFHLKIEQLQKDLGKCNATNSKDFVARVQGLSTVNDLISYQSGQAAAATGRRFDLTPFVASSGVSICRAITKDFLSSLATKFDANLQSVTALMHDQVSFCNQLAKTWQDRVTLLQAEKGKVAEQKKEEQASDIFRTLPWIVISLCIFSCLILFGVRFFSPDVQLELVSSGQIIQFPTVMVLLVVVIALGLVGILHENSLAALLGGLAGYVLSQGVGQAAARRAMRERAATSNPEQEPEGTSVARAAAGTDD